MSALQQQQPKQRQSSGPPSPIDPEFLKKTEKYLLDNMWVQETVDEFGRSTWIDPQGQDGVGKEQFIREIANRDGTTKPLKQLVIPPPNQAYVMQEAIFIQKSRDKHAAKVKARAEAQKAALEAKEKQEEALRG